MADALSLAPYQGVNTPFKRCVILPVVATAGSGNGTLTIDTARSAPGFTVSGTAGAYTGTMPKTPRGVAWGQCFQATADGAIINFTAFSSTAGTFSFETHHGDTTSGGEALANGDQVWLFFMLEGG